MNAMLPSAPLLTVYVLVFGAAMLLADSAIHAIGARRQNRRVNRRLGLVAAGKTRGEVLKLLRPAQRSSGGPTVLRKIVAWLETRLRQAGRTMPAAKLFLMMLLGTAAIAGFFLVVTIVLGRLTSVAMALSPLVLATILGFGLPMFVLNLQAKRRIKAFDKQFPMALDIFVRGLRAGHPVGAALDLLTTEMADPCGSEFGIVIDEVNYGLDLRDALTNLADRIGSQDVQMFVVCVAIQSETGGNLAEILEGLTRVIRERMGMVMKVKALASEGKMTGLMLSILPLFTFSVVFSMSPNFYLSAAGDPWFIPGFGGILTLYTVGILTIRKLVDLKV